MPLCETRAPLCTPVKNVCERAQTGGSRVSSIPDLHSPLCTHSVIKILEHVDHGRVDHPTS